MNPAWRARVGTLLLVALAACGSGDQQAATTTSTAAPAASTTTTVPDPVELVSPGDEPRRVLRLAPRVGSEQALTLRQDQEQRVTVDGQSTSIPAPITEMDVRYRVRAVDGEEITVDTVYEAARVVDERGADEATVDSVREVLESMVDATSETVFTNRGAVVRTSELDIDFPDEMAAMGDALLAGLSDQMGALAVPFPVEAVGRGARWRVKNRANISGLTIDVVNDVELRSVTAGAVEGVIKQTLTFVPGKTEVMGYEAEVERGTLTGEGGIRWDLAGVSAFMDQRIEGTSVLVMEGDDGPVRIDQFQRQHIQTRPR